MCLPIFGPMCVCVCGDTPTCTLPHQSVCSDLHPEVAPRRCHPMTGDPIWSSLAWSPLCHWLPCIRCSVLSKHISPVLISQALTLLSPPALPLSLPPSAHILHIFLPHWRMDFSLCLESNHLLLLVLSCYPISIRVTSQWTACRLGHVYLDMYTHVEICSDIVPLWYVCIVC